MCGDHAVRLDITGTPYRLFPIVRISKLKQVKDFFDRPKMTLTIDDEERFDFALLPEDSWESDRDEGELEVEKIVEVRSGRKTRFGRVHRQFKVYW